VRFPFVADGERARRELGFAPRHASRDALLAYLEYRHPQARLTAAEAPA
jgi:nucleoside-diphosphate-sugar epimerase